MNRVAFAANWRQEDLEITAFTSVVLMAAVAFVIARVGRRKDAV
jgi:hypothetical protein